MGEVYRARDARLDRDVAIKVLPEELATNAQALARFERESRAVAALSHPHLLALHDVGKDGSVSYAVMELLEGETLRERLHHGALPPRKAVGYAVQIAEGLAAAHAKGIVHRDLKPENIFLTKDGSLKILDFGLAKLTRPAVPLTNDSTAFTAAPGTEVGVVLGTAGYMSPEQVRGKPVDPRSDLFSFGAVLYEMLTGERAFPGTTTADTMAAILTKDPPALSGRLQGVSQALERIVTRCLEKEADARFHSAHDLAFALRSLPSASAAAAESPLTRRRRTAPVWALAGAGALVVLAAALLWLRSRAPGSRSAAQLNPKRVLVLPFENRTQDERFNPVGTMAADWIIQGLTQTGVMQAIPLATALAYARDANWKSVPGGNPERFGALANELGAGTVVSGACYLSGGNLQMQAEVFDMRERKLLGAVEPTEASIENPLEAVHSLRHRVIGMLAMHLNPRSAPVAARRQCAAQLRGLPGLYRRAGTPPRPRLPRCHPLLRAGRGGEPLFLPPPSAGGVLPRKPRRACGGRGDRQTARPGAGAPRASREGHARAARSLLPGGHHGTALSLPGRHPSWHRWEERATRTVGTRCAPIAREKRSRPCIGSTRTLRLSAIGYPTGGCFPGHSTFSGTTAASSRAHDKLVSFIRALSSWRLQKAEPWLLWGCLTNWNGCARTPSLFKVRLASKRVR